MMILRKIQYIIGCVGLALLAACSSEPSTPGAVKKNIPITATINYSLELQTAPSLRTNRSDAAPVVDGFIPGEPLRAPEYLFPAILTGSRAAGDSIPGDAPGTMGVFGEMRGSASSVFINKCFYHRGSDEYLEAYRNNQGEFSKWSENQEWPYIPIKYWEIDSVNHTTLDYQFYAYAPWQDDSHITLHNNTFDEMFTLTWVKIPPFARYSFMVARGIASRKSYEIPQFQMVHLSSRIRLRYTIGEKYAELRDVRIKSVSVKDHESTGITFTQCDVDIPNGTFTLKSNGIYTPGPDIQIVPIDPDAVGDSAQGMTLVPGEYKSFGSLYVMPEDLYSITVNVVYDVYDKTGQKLRENQVSTNTIKIGKSVESGKYYDLLVMVSPRYLYVLSDNDVVPDGLIDVPADL